MTKKVKDITRVIGVISLIVAIVDNYFFSFINIGFSDYTFYIGSIASFCINVFNVDKEDRNKIDVFLLIVAIVIPFLLSYLHRYI